MRAATSLLALVCGVVLADTCADSLSSHSYWRIDELVLKVYDWDNGGSTGTFGFKSYYSATNKTAECLAENVDLAKLGNTWSKCNEPGTEFQFNFKDISLALRETWICSGATFSANATGDMMLHGCLENDTEMGAESDCNVMEFEMAANVTSESAKAPPGHDHH
ncbi:hypothetical protein B0T16DRAFT_328912 [Cercophora newfieldiana]|uniref:AA1-like domain-containing protein n=1 Tax=Cercophora newfieldiana TaxID=92897 RepID=A0AA39Y842_9PEZI|nr:hypothetical protein B0T16DRAFT_328912 [Cercophora newfieldiana]